MSPDSKSVASHPVSVEKKSVCSSPTVEETVITYGDDRTAGSSTTERGPGHSSEQNTPDRIDRDTSEMPVVAPRPRDVSPSNASELTLSRQDSAYQTPKLPYYRPQASLAPWAKPKPTQAWGARSFAEVAATEPYSATDEPIERRTQAEQSVVMGPEIQHRKQPEPEQPEKALPYTGRTLEDYAKIRSVFPLALINDVLLFFCLQLFF